MRLIGVRSFVTLISSLTSFLIFNNSGDVFVDILCTSALRTHLNRIQLLISLFRPFCSTAAYIHSSINIIGDNNNRQQKAQFSIYDRFALFVYHLHTYSGLFYFTIWFGLVCFCVMCYFWLLCFVYYCYYFSIWETRSFKISIHWIVFYCEYSVRCSRHCSAVTDLNW